MSKNDDPNDVAGYDTSVFPEGVAITRAEARAAARRTGTRNTTVTVSVGTLVRALGGKKK